MPDKIIRLAQVLNVTGLSESTIRRLEKKGAFPSKKQISEFRIGYSMNEVQKWVDGKLNIKNN